MGCDDRWNVDVMDHDHRNSFLGCYAPKLLECGQFRVHLDRQGGSLACSRPPSGCNDSPRLGSTVETKPRLAKERMDCTVHTGSILYHLVRHCIVHHGFPESHPCTPHSLGAFVHRRTAHCVREDMQSYRSTLKTTRVSPRVAWTLSVRAHGGKMSSD